MQRIVGIDNRNLAIFGRRTKDGGHMRAAFVVRRLSFVFPQHLEQPRLVAPILLDRAVEIEMLVSDIGQQRHIEHAAHRRH